MSSDKCAETCNAVNNLRIEGYSNFEANVIFLAWNNNPNFRTALANRVYCEECPFKPGWLQTIIVNSEKAM